MVRANAVRGAGRVRTDGHVTQPPWWGSKEEWWRGRAAGQSLACMDWAVDGLVRLAGMPAGCAIKSLDNCGVPSGNNFASSV